MPKKFIKIYHPDMEGEGEATEDAFEKVWKAKGFRKGPRPQKTSRKSTKEEKKTSSVKSDDSDDESTTED